MTERQKHVLRIERTFDAPAEAVFEAWTRVEVLRRWLHVQPDWDTPIAEVDLRVGGTIRVVMRNPTTGSEWGARGQYTLIEPPRRLAFTWIWDHDPSNPQLIELQLSEEDGRTTVMMVNSGIPTDQARHEQGSGWHRCYDNLAAALNSGYRDQSDRGSPGGGASMRR